MIDLNSSIRLRQHLNINQNDAKLNFTGLNSQLHHLSAWPLSICPGVNKTTLKERVDLLLTGIILAELYMHVG